MSERATFIPVGLYGVQETSSARVFKVRNRPHSFLPQESVVPGKKEHGVDFIPSSIPISRVDMQPENMRVDSISVNDSKGKEVVIPLGQIRDRVAHQKQFNEDNPALIESIKQRIARLRNRVADESVDEDRQNLKDRIAQFGLYTLTPAEYFTLYITSYGLTYPQTAEVIGISPDTHKNHLASVLHKLDMKSGQGAWMAAVRHNFIDPELLPSFPDQRAVYRLSIREREAFDAIVANPDMTNRELGEILFIDENTVKNHKTKIIDVIGAKGSSNAIFHYSVGWSRWEDQLRQGEVSLTSTEERVYARLQEGRSGISIMDEFGLDLVDMGVAVQVLRVRFGDQVISMSQVGDLRYAMMPNIDGTTINISEREKQVLRYIWEGRSNGYISEMLGISVSTVKNLLSPLYIKIGVSNRQEATVWATHNKINTGEVVLDHEKLALLDESHMKLLMAHADESSMASTSQVAEALDLSHSTVKNKRGRLYKELEVTTPQQLHYIAKALLFSQREAKEASNLEAIGSLGVLQEMAAD